MGRRAAPPSELQPGVPQPGAAVARALGIYLGQLYGWIKQGKVKNYKEDGYPNGKGVEVLLEEARAVWMTSKKKGPRAARTPGQQARVASKRAKRAGEPADLIPREKRLKPGTIISYEKGQPGHSDYARRPAFNVAQVVGSTGQITFLDDGNRRVHYTGMVIDDLVFTTQRLSYMMARGVARIERPHQVLGMVLLSFILEGNVELAQSLENWMLMEGLDVQVPEIMDVPEESADDETAVAVGADDD